jgi:hypothetical protein
MIMRVMRVGCFNIVSTVIDVPVTVGGPSGWATCAGTLARI